MAVLAKAEGGLARNIRLLDGERFDEDVSAAEKNITSPRRVRPL